MVRLNRLKAGECVGAKGHFGGPRARLVPNLGDSDPEKAWVRGDDSNTITRLTCSLINPW
jgi:hypothetical protein